MSVRTVNVTYSKSGGTFLPGYVPETQFFGFGTQSYNGSLAPGLSFLIWVAGSLIMLKMPLTTGG